MAYEPINIFSHKIDVRGVLRILREVASEVRVEGPEDDWQQAIVYGPKRFLRSRLELVVGHSSEYYDGEDWPMQVLGMRNYFSGFPDVPRKLEILRLIASFRFSLAFPSADLDIDSNDERRAWVFAICRHLDGVIFTPSSLRDAAGRVLISAGGRYDNDAVMPRIPPTEDAPGAVDSSDDSDSPDEEDQEPEPQAAQRVARRALVLAAVCNRGLIENECGNFDEPDKIRQRMLQWVSDLELQDEVETEEWKALQRPVGTLDLQSAINATWRLEGLAVLAWALGKVEMQPYDELVNPGDLFDALCLFDKEGASTLLAEATLRSAEELAEYQTQALAMNWRMRDFRIRPQAMDFVAFSRKCWFGSFSLAPFRILESDLAIGDRPIAQAEEGLVQRCQSSAQERHLAINWQFGYSRLYSETDTST